jgi:hypothetical protein
MRNVTRPRLTDDQVVRLYDAIKEELLSDQNLEIILKSSPEDLVTEVIQ